MPVFLPILLPLLLRLLAVSARLIQNDVLHHNIPSCTLTDGIAASPIGRRYAFVRDPYILSGEVNLTGQTSNIVTATVSDITQTLVKIIAHELGHTLGL